MHVGKILKKKDLNSWALNFALIFLTLLWLGNRFGHALHIF